MILKKLLEIFMKGTNQKNKMHKNARNVWKYVAVGFIVVFAVFILGGVLKAYNMRNSFGKATSEEKDLAVKVASAKLEELGIDSSKFQLRISDQIKKKDKNGPDTVHIIFYSQGVTHSFLIDVDSGTILIHSLTEVYFPMNGAVHPFDKPDLIVLPPGFTSEGDRK